MSFNSCLQCLSSCRLMPTSKRRLNNVVQSVKFSSDSSNLLDRHILADDLENLHPVPQHLALGTCDTEYFQCFINISMQLVRHVETRRCSSGTTEILILKMPRISKNHNSCCPSMASIENGSCWHASLTRSEVRLRSARVYSLYINAQSSLSELCVPTPPTGRSHGHPHVRGLPAQQRGSTE